VLFLDCSGEEVGILELQIKELRFGGEEGWNRGLQTRPY